MYFLQLLSIMSNNNSFIPTDYTTTEKVVVIEARITANVSSNIKPNKATWMNSITTFQTKSANFPVGVLGLWWQCGKVISTLVKSSPLQGRLAVLLTLSVCAAVDKDVGRYPATNHQQMRGPKGPQRHRGLPAMQAEQVVITQGDIAMHSALKCLGLISKC